VGSILLLQAVLLEGGVEIEILRIYVPGLNQPAGALKIFAPGIARRIKDCLFWTATGSPGERQYLSVVEAIRGSLAPGLLGSLIR